jgi:hypothetical protein
MGYQTGFSAVKEAIEAAASSGGDFGKAAHPIDVLRPVSWKDKENFAVRILTENVLKIGFHEFVKCRDNKSRDFVCTDQLDGPLQRPCWICKNITRKVTDKSGNEKIVPVKPRTVVIAIVAVKDYDRPSKTNVERPQELEILVDPNDPDGPTQKVECPTFGVVKQGVKGFWAAVNGYYAKFETYVDRDYDITRDGDGLDTKYTIIADSRDDELDTPEKLWDYYGIPPVEGEDDPVFARLVQWMERRGTEEYYNRHLIGGSTESSPSNSDDESEDDENEGSEEEKPKASVGGRATTSFAELRAQVTKRYPSSK